MVAKRASGALLLLSVGQVLGDCSDHTGSILCFDFESAPVGATLGAGVEIVAGTSKSGSKSMQFTSSNPGSGWQAAYLKTNNKLTGTHWGRAFIKIQGMTGGFMHTSFVAAKTSSYEVRVVDTVKDNNGGIQLLYNFNDDQDGASTAYDYGSFDDGSWQCTEWHLDQGTQQYEFFLNDARIDAISGPSTNRVIPQDYDWMAFGAQVYQGGPQAIGWMDDIVVSTTRVGCGGTGTGTDATVDLERAARGFGAHIEGTGVDPDGNVYAVHYRNTQDTSFNGNLNTGRNVVGKIDYHTGLTSPYFTGPNSASYNGIRFDQSGQHMFLADVAQRKIMRVDTSSMVSETFCSDAGMGPGLPNDLALAKDGRVFLSGQDWDSGAGGLWMCSADGTATNLGAMDRTNGICLSPDDQYLYLSEATGSPVASDAGHQVIWRYEVTATGITNKQLFFDLGKAGEAKVDTDGMRTDSEGNLYLTRNGGSKVMVVSKEGKLVRTLPLTTIKFATNLEMGGADGKTLYVVGRCGDQDWGNGDGCVEELAALYPGRQWAWFQELMGNTDDADNGSISDDAQSGSARVSLSSSLLALPAAFLLAVLAR